MKFYLPVAQNVHVDNKFINLIKYEFGLEMLLIQIIVKKKKRYIK